ncbi:hypothetical protein [Amycolatopsis anabasis]|uniref:hypothetical protein n=1 Tax=Amycolatopsis anabasis TaxID=1840409 RepID=UPI00131E0624|nr:hypothetical protein [Amycolatopsis anabasis]
MTDFVDRLLGRPGAPPIRPVVPSLFEPITSAGAEPPLPMGTFTGSEPGPQRTDEPRPVDTTAGNGGEPPAPAPVPAPPIAVVREPIAPPPVPAESTGEKAPPTAVVHQVTGEPAPIPTAPQTPAPVRVPGERRVETVREIVHHTAPPAAAPATHPVSAVRVPEPPEPAYPREPPPAPVPPASHPVRPVAPGFPAVPPIPVAAPVPLRREPSEPDVHITIGRVEVKAAVEAERPKRRDPGKRPVLSLDEYLRGRAGGDRA